MSFETPSSLFHSEDTICALATPEGKGGLAVIRVSGKDSYSIVRKLCPFLKKNLETHKIYYGFLEALKGESLDEVLVSYFATGKSFTGEEVLEISCHGSGVLAQSVLHELLKAGCRLAQPGEFTLRAFLNQKIDLIQAESIHSLVQSQTESSALQFVSQLQGKLSSKIKSIEEALVKILAYIEADIDFSEEEISLEKNPLLESLKRTQNSLKTLLQSYTEGKTLKKGLKIVLMGKTNVGKSSLFNAFLNTERAIVSPLKGTTRDFITEPQRKKNFVIEWIDTAGLRNTDHEVEKQGLERTRKLAEKSDFIFYVIDSTCLVDFDDISEIKRLDLNKVFLVFNKIDLKEPSSLSIKIRDRLFYLHPVSALRKEGLKELLEKVYEKVSYSNLNERESLVTEVRHFELINKSYKNVECALKQNNTEEMAYYLKKALDQLHQLLGKTYDEQVLDKIFKEFCLGK